MDVASKTPQYGPILRGTLQKLAVINKFGLLEYRIEVSLAVFLTISGVVILILYKRNLAQQNQNMGRAAYMAFLVADILLCVAVGKISTDLVRLPEMINLYYGGTMYGIQYPGTLVFGRQWGRLGDLTCGVGDHSWRPHQSQTRG
ncbi:hypothetical protein FSP39_001677 [Pinctada imbricata]|uniref:Uncharacterized protein n=1 Tax=Pinctada imbricata TaxID=66713 RepID=A0AA89BS53_PINIB|nr:hypothetical protein FSP39_001677 [Pinctada imbricata]